MRLREPLDEFPIVGRKQFLFVRGAGGQFDQVLQRAELLAGARAHQMKLNREAKTRRVIGIGLRLANDAKGGARRIEMDWFGREKPVFEFADELLFQLGFLDLREAVEVGVRG